MHVLPEHRVVESHCNPHLSMVRGAELFNYLLNELMVEGEENRQT